MSFELILGGARSGKSRLAEQKAAASGMPVHVLVTAEAMDAEMCARIARHQADRPAGWITHEVPRSLGAVLPRVAREGRCVIVDCLTVWLANLMQGAEHLPPGIGGEALPLLQDERGALLQALPTLPGHIILVANEVGLGLVPDTPLGRMFRDEAGRLNQMVAAMAEEVTFVAAGLPLLMKGKTNTSACK
jgi:adenosylcobinamide kinase/adenosylcobinamide-phosphate guanylyltransferase